jgi:hypothetical protein
VRVRHPILLASLILAPLAARFALLAWAPPPLPEIHDEFCYLLAGETFAAGRLTNPAHPMWRHLETFHVLHQPSYNAKYPPGQGLLLAAGMRLAGQAWLGVVAGYVLMLGAFFWAFHGWLPRRWAVVAAALAVVRFPVGHYWLNSYWGGALAAAAGALLVGAAGRMRRRLSAPAAVAAGLGLAVLAMSRPYEGLVLALALVLPSCPALWRQRRQWTALVPGLAVLAAGLAWLGWYNHAVTGSAWKLPYLVYERQYVLEPNSHFFPSREGVTARHEMLGRLLLQKIPFTREKAITQSLQILEVVRISKGWEGYATPVIGLGALAAIPFALRRRSGRLPAVALLLALAPLLASRWYMEHYGAPAASLRLLVLTIGLRSAAAWFGWRRAPRVAWRAGLAVIALQISLYAVFSVAGWRTVTGFPADRAAVTDRLVRRGGKHLVIVRYAAHHNAHQEWVYNAADIDRSPVVWARDMGEEANRELRGYFKDRAVWLMEPDSNPREPQPY